MEVTETNSKKTCNNVLLQEEHQFCLRCGRKLKSPESKQLGYGKICYSKAMKYNYKRQTLFN